MDDVLGGFVDGEFLVSEETNLSQASPAVTALAHGGLAVTWHSDDGVDDTSDAGIKARTFNADGTPAEGPLTDADTAHTIAAAELLANDSDRDGDTLTISDVAATSTLGATVTLNGDGSVSYDPTGSATLDAMAQGAVTEDSFTYTISDGNGGTDTATVTLAVAGVNDAPVAVGALIATNENGAAVSGQLTAYDVDGDTLSYALDTGPANGTVSINPDGSYSSTPDVGYSGGDSFTFTATDGFLSDEATVEVNIAGDPAPAKTLVGTEGGDVLISGAGDDRLDGAAGDDRIEDLGGNDTLTGGTGADSFVFSIGDGQDVITDFEVGTDVLVLNAQTIAYRVEVDTTGDSTADSTLVAFGDGASVLLQSVLGVIDDSELL